jgi:hypothetical protein
MGRWSFQDERYFIEIAKTAKSLDEIVERTGRAPTAIRRIARRLGVTLAEQIASDTQLLAARDRKRKQHPIPAGTKKPAGSRRAKSRVVNTLRPA